MKPTLRVVILAFDDFEALDLAGPCEVFTTTSRMALRAAPDAPAPFEVTCVSRSPAPVRMRAGLSVRPGHSFDDVPPAEPLALRTARQMDFAWTRSAQ